MEIDLNNNELTLESLTRLIASKDDSTNTQLRVNKQGILFLSEEVGSSNTEGLLFRFCTFTKGADYVGEVASKDRNHIERIFIAINENWPNPKSTYIETF